MNKWNSNIKIVEPRQLKFHKAPKFQIEFGEVENDPDFVSRHQVNVPREHTFRKDLQISDRSLMGG